jgi:hypothetical protein
MKRPSIVKPLFLVTLLAVVPGCSSDTVGPSEGSQPSLRKVAGTAIPAVSLNPLGTLVRCTAQPYARATKLVGPQGGELQAGKNKFTIPRGALLLPVQITMEAVSDTVRSVRFSPEGLVFSPLHQPTLKLDLKGCKPPLGTKTKVAWTTERLLILQTLRTSTDSVNATANADLQHFSRYALAW